MSKQDNDNLTLDSSDLSPLGNAEKIVESQTIDDKKESRSDLVAIEENFESLESLCEDAFKVLKAIAKTNEVLTPWSELRIMLNELISKQSRIMDPKINDKDVRNEIDKVISSISHILGVLQDCPFTIQRACELIIKPNQHYNTYIKYLRAFEKIIAVTSSWKAFASSNTESGIDQNNTDKIRTPFIFDDINIPTEPLEGRGESTEAEEPSKINGVYENKDTTADELEEKEKQDTAASQETVEGS
ncbi:PPP4R2-domain-containing protein [Sporodiniella umbellata]|nr:PPP4R2-domain-containing protein [Sporodiniella umbellata]